MGFIRKSVIAAGAQVFLVFVGLVGSIILSRWLGPEGRGVVILFNLVVTTSTSFATLGLGTAYAYLAGKRQYAMSRLIANALVMSLVLGGAVIGVLMSFAPLLLDTLLRGMSMWQLLAAAGAMPFALLTLFLGSMLLASGDVERAAIMQAYAGLIMTAVISFALIAAGQGVSGVIVLTAAVTVLTGVWYLFVLVRKHGCSFAGMGDVSRVALVFGAKAYLGSLGAQSWLRADVFVLNAFTGPAAVGFYSLATSLTERLWILDSSVAQAVLSEVIGSEREEAARLVAKTCRNVAFITGLTAVLLGLAAPHLIPFVYGAEFRPAVLPLVLLLPGTIAIAAGRPIASYYYGQLGKPLLTSVISIATAVVSVSLYLLLVPAYGTMGAAIASSVGYSVPLLAYLALLTRDTSVTVSDLLILKRSDLQMYGRIARTFMDRIIGTGRRVASAVTRALRGRPSR